MNRRQWKISACDKEQAALLAEKHSIDPFISLLLVSRGITEPYCVDEFFSTDVVLGDPFEIVDMAKATDRIDEALKKNEKIAVYGDYDADGVTATALVYSYLRDIGANVTCFIPDRMTDGYGMSKDAVDNLKQQNVSVIITVDNGIGAVEETEYAKKNGIDMVITDHHKAGETLPDAVAVVDPQREDCHCLFKEWAGVGVAFKLLCALEGGDGEGVLTKYGDIIAIGTLADVVSLTDENRVIVKSGLMKINTNPSVGIAAIKSVALSAQKSLSAMGVAFTVAPRINAAGRMGSAERALELLLCDDEDEAKKIALEIDELNKQRQGVEAEITAQAIEAIEKNNYKYDNVIVVSGKDWHSGVIGIVAARLVERYGRPAVVISVNDNEARGSGRSMGDFSLFDAFSACSDVLTHFGGHTLAAGMGVNENDIDLFRTKINEYAEKVNMPFPELSLDCKLNPAYVTVELASLLSAMEPFGCGNAQPLFGLYNMQITLIKPIGDGKHIRLALKKNDTVINAVKFGVSVDRFPFVIGDTVDVAVKIEKNEFRGEEKASVQVRDIRFSQTDEGKRVACVRLFERFMRDESLLEDEKTLLTPNREFIGSVYRFIKKNGGWAFDEETLLKRMNLEMNLLSRLMLSLEVMAELHILEKAENDTYKIPESVSKTELSSSLFLQKLGKGASQ